MGEAKRRKAFEGRLWRELLPGNDAAALIGSVLQNLVDLLDCMVFLKEAQDGLLDWPPCRRPCTTRKFRPRGAEEWHEPSECGAGIRDRAIAISCVTSSFPVDNSTTSRGAAMMQGLVQRIN
jgi:hypothetical protein